MAQRSRAAGTPQVHVLASRRTHQPARFRIARQTVELRDLGDRIGGDVVLPGDADLGRGAAGVEPGRRPAAGRRRLPGVARTTSRRPSRFAAEQGLRIAFNAGGHNAGPIDWSRDTLLLKTERMTRDRDRRRRAARAGRGRACCRSRSRSRPAEHGLAYLAGTSPNVGVLGLRARGRPQLDDPHATAWPATASSRPRSSRPTAGASGPTATRSPSCSGRCAAAAATSAAVTAIELELFPIAEIYAGGLFWPIERATEVLNAWRDVDRDRARRLRVARADAPAARRPVPARAPARPRRSSWSRLAFIGTAADGDALAPAAARPRPGVRHRRDDAGEATSAS